MASMRREAQDTYHGKLGRMGLKVSTASLGEDEGVGHVNAAEDGTQGVRPAAYAKGYETAEANERTLSDKAGKPRLDRPGFKHGGRVKHKGTTVNVIVAPQQPKPMAPPMLPPGAGAPPPPMPPPGMGGPGPGTAPGPMMGGGPGPMPRKHGGAVKMDDGAGSGAGRLEKKAKYGKNARP